MSHFSNIANTIHETLEKGAVENLELEGATGEKVIGLLQRLSKLLGKDECYVEIGVYRGKSLISVAKSVPEINTFGIDNFSQFDKDGYNKSVIENLKEKYSLRNVDLINMDFEDAFQHLEKYLKGKKIGLLFIDGPHDYRSQLVCILFAKKFLSEKAIIVVDNANYNHVRQATADFVQSHSEYKLFFEAYSRSHPANLRGKELDDAWKNWLDGINLIVRDSQHELEYMQPDTIRDRTLFFNDHRIHPMRNSVLAWRGAKLAAAAKPFKPWLFFGFLIKLFIEVRKRDNREIEPYLYINSHSEKLPEFRLNNSVKKQAK